MRDPAGQLAYRIHALGLAQALRHHLPLRRIDTHARHVQRVAPGISRHSPLIRQPADPSIGKHNPEFVVQPAAILESAPDRAGHKRPIVGVDPVDEMLVLGHLPSRLEAIEVVQAARPSSGRCWPRPTARCPCGRP